jgi:hypothetical protein
LGTGSKASKGGLAVRASGWSAGHFGLWRTKQEFIRYLRFFVAENISSTFPPEMKGCVLAVRLFYFFIYRVIYPLLSTDYQTDGPSIYLRG